MPDIAVEVDGIYVFYEVKSTMTIDNNGKNPQLGRKNLAKWQAAAKLLNRTFETYVFDRRGNIIKIIKTFPNDTISSYGTIQQLNADQSDNGHSTIANFTFGSNGDVADETIVESISDFMDIIQYQDEDNFSEDDDSTNEEDSANDEEFDIVNIHFFFLYNFFIQLFDEYTEYCEES